MKLSWLILAILGGQIGLAESVRMLNCEFALPRGESKTLSAPINEGKAKIEVIFEIDLKDAGLSETSEMREYIVTSEVWGFRPDAKRVAGYLQVKQIKKSLTEPPTYAINHCELRNYREACRLEIVTMLNGIGTHANCTAPEL